MAAHAEGGRREPKRVIMTMKFDVSYDRQTLKTPNPIARFAHRRRYATTLDLVSRLVPDRGRLLDFGCGTGSFLIQLAEAKPGLDLFGFDPESGHVAQQYAHVANMLAVPDASLDVVCCFETLEHLHPHEFADFVAHTKRVLRANGLLVVSVPIIGGPPLLIKELNRMVLFRRKTDYLTGELLQAALFGRPAPRADNIRGSHKGFDFQALRGGLLKEFALIETRYSPIPALPWFLNSQVFWVFKLPAGTGKGAPSVPR